MKKLCGIFLIIVTMIFGVTACNSGNTGGGNSPNGNGGTVAPPDATASAALIAYFSCTNTTEGIARHIQSETNGTLYEIVPEVPYTADDLKYYTDCRADREQADDTARPAINGSVADMEKYDVIFLGYPIWHGQAPKIVYTFVESYDFSGKTIVPFCTSHSSGIGSSDANLHPLAPSAEWIDGKRFGSGASQNTVAEWIDGLGLKLTDNTSSPIIQDEVITKMYLTINDNKIEVTLAENSAADALVEILKRGDITYTASDYGGFEKVGSLGHTLPTSNSQITTQPGDVILYSGDQIVLFYGSNSWSYTRLGKINGYSADELKNLLCAGKGDVQVTISLK